MIKRYTTLLVLFCLVLVQTTTVKAEINSELNIDQSKIQSETYLLYDRTSKRVLLEKNGFKAQAPASLTKVLTSITALDLLEEDLDTVYTLPQAVFDGLDPIASVAWFEPNEDLTLRDILHGIQLPSGADATRAMSYYLTQDPEKLVDAMNEKASEIGMHNSHFINTSGLDAQGHYATAYDLAILVDYALENEEFKEIYEAQHYTTSISHIHPHGIEFTNRPLEYALKQDNRYIKGAKSGYTENAGYALSSYASYKGQELIFISIGIHDEKADAKNTVADALYVYDAVFSRYKLNLALPKNTIFDSLKINNGQDYQYALDEDLFLYLPKGIGKDDLDFKISKQPEKLIAPIEKGTDMGTLKVSYRDKVIYTKDFKTETIIPVEWEVVIKEFIVYLLEILMIVAIIVALGLLLYKQVNKPKRR